MPKRNRKELDEYINKKFKDLEKKLKRKKRRRILSSSSSSSSASRSSSQDSEARRSETSDRNDKNGAPKTAPEKDKENVNSAPNQDGPDQIGPSINHLDARPPTSMNAPEDVEMELDASIMEILGIDPTKSIKYGDNIQKDLAVRFEHGVTKGLLVPERKNLLEKHLIPDNCRIVDAPTLNPELKGALSDFMIKRDKTIEAQQRVTAAAISSLGQSITLLLSAKDKNTGILSSLMDTARLLCDRQHTDTKTRRGFIINAVKKEMRESLENSTIDRFLFGHNLADTLKTAKVVNKTSSDLAVRATSKPVPTNKSTPKNWTSSHAARKPHASAALKTKNMQPPPVPMRGQRSSNYNPSSNQRPQRSRR